MESFQHYLFYWMVWKKTANALKKSLWSRMVVFVAEMMPSQVSFGLWHWYTHHMYCSGKWEATFVPNKISLKCEVWSAMPYLLHTQWNEKAPHDTKNGTFASIIGGLDVDHSLPGKWDILFTRVCFLSFIRGRKLKWAVTSQGNAQEHQNSYIVYSMHI